MAKFTLDSLDSSDADFLLIGMSSHAKIYRLCWSLNQHMNLKLINSNTTIELPGTKKQLKNTFEVYKYFDEVSRIDYHIIPNKSGNGFLLPEFKHIDYLMLLKENLEINLSEVITKAKLSDQVLMAFEINIEEVNSIENLLF